MREVSLDAARASRFGPLEEIEPLAPDASVREFYRIRRREEDYAVLLVDRAGGARAARRMVRAQQILEQAGVPVPALLDADLELGSLLFEDFGDRLLADELPRLPRAEAERLLREAGRIAGRIACIDPPAKTEQDPLARPRLGRIRLRAELAFFLVHELASRRDLRDLEQLAELGHAMDIVAGAAAESPVTLAHRDFHSRNLLIRDSGALGVVDFQDALAAPRHYDLVSLAWDPYTGLDEGLRAQATRGYTETCGAAADCFEDALTRWIAIQRLLKAIGTYAFQATRLERAQFLAFIEPAAGRALSLLEQIGDGKAERVHAALRDAGLGRVTDERSS